MIRKGLLEIMIDTQLKGNALTVFLKGRINSANISAIESEINKAIASHPSEGLILDCSGLEYLSSAGLRTVLRLRKAFKNFKVINVVPDVYDICEMTGFTEMMDVR